jgi:nicotinamide phosphoribosyltransferase
LPSSRHKHVKDRSPIKTDVGKRSKRGRLALSENFETVRLEELGDRGNLLEPIYKNGKLLKDYTFDEVRGA